MHKLFALSQLRTIQRLGVTQFTPDLYEQIAKNNNFAIRGQALLYRLPREELKHTINIQCPINSLEQKYADVIINAAKELRRHGGIKQNRICAACQFVNTCPQAKKELENKEIQDGLKNMLVLFYGLQNLAKPEAIFFRQWVSAYRLGDSLISAVNDLAQGGIEIDDYDKIRQEGIRLAHERLAKKQLLEAEKGSKTKVEEMLKTVQQVRKPERKPKAKAAAEIKQAKQDADDLGNGGLFEKDESFEPKSKFTRDNPPRQDRPSLEPLHKQKGYQKIGEQSYKKPYQGVKTERKPYTQDYNRQSKPNKDNYKQRSFDDGARKDSYGGKDNFEKKNYKPAYQKPAFAEDEGYPKIKSMNRSKSYGQGQRQESYDAKKRGGNYGEQRDFKQREYKPRQFQNRQTKQYQPRQSRQYKPRQYQPRQPRQQRQYQPRQQRKNRQYKNLKEGERDPQTKTYTKENPHLSKWNIENDMSSRPSSKSINQKKQFTTAQRNEPKSQPKIIEAEQISFTKSANSQGGRRGRSVRRSRGNTPTQNGEE